MRSTQQVRAFYHHRYWTKVQDLVNIKVYWWSKSKFSHFLSKENISGEGVTSLLVNKNDGWWPPASSCLEQRAASWEAKTILTLLHLQKKGPPIISCWLADYRPEYQHYLTEWSGLWDFLWSLSQIFMQQRLTPLKPPTSNHITYKRENTLAM